MELLGGAVFALLITTGLVYYLVTRDEPGESPRRGRGTTLDDSGSLESRIEAMERRAAELEHQLAALDEEDEQGEDSSLDWAANTNGPSFDMGDADIPLEIEYRDAGGRTSRREITVQRYRYAGARGHLSAYCHGRGAQRTFLFSRIKSAVDPLTGEVIAELGPWLDEHFEASPIGQAAGALDRHYAALTIMFYVAKADAAFRQREKAIMREFLIDEGAQQEVAIAILDTVSRWATPSAIAYGKALRALAPAPADYRLRVKRAAAALVASDKTVHHKESLALKRLESEVPKD